MTRPRFSMVLALAGAVQLTAAAPARAESPMKQVALDKLMEWVRDTAPGKVKAATAPKGAARIDWYTDNFRALAAAVKKPVFIPVRPGGELANALMEGQKLKWDIIWEFTLRELPKAYPSMATSVAALEALAMPGFVVGGIFATTDAGYGSAFEFCTPGDANPERAAKYIQRMMGTYEPKGFAAVLKRKGCADSMLGYLSSPGG